MLCAAQLPDGSIDHAGVVSEPPSVMIISELDDGGGGCELPNVSMQDARKLAQRAPRGCRRDRPVGDDLRNPQVPKVGPSPLWWRAHDFLTGVANQVVCKSEPAQSVDDS